MSDVRQLIRIKFIFSIAFSITRKRPQADRPLKPLGRNWAKAFKTRYLVLQARRVKPLNWNRYEKNIYRKVIYWFKVIGKILQNPTILAENVYNTDDCACGRWAVAEGAAADASGLGEDINKLTVPAHHSHPVVPLRPRPILAVRLELQANTLAIRISARVSSSETTLMPPLCIATCELSKTAANLGMWAHGGKRLRVIP